MPARGRTPPAWPGARRTEERPNVAIHEAEGRHPDRDDPPGLGPSRQAHSGRSESICSHGASRESIGSPTAALATATPRSALVGHRRERATARGARPDRATPWLRATLRAPYRTRTEPTLRGMAWRLRFWRRLRIAPGVSVNLSKSGASASAGPRGAKVTVGRQGATQSLRPRGLLLAGLGRRQVLVPTTRTPLTAG
jgi:hypothetical protein